MKLRHLVLTLCLLMAGAPLLELCPGTDSGIECMAQNKKGKKKKSGKKNNKKKKNNSATSTGPRTSGEAQRQQQAVQHDIELTQEQIEENERQMKENLATLGRLQADIEESQQKINALQQKVDNTTAQISQLESDIAKHRQQLETMRSEYGKAVKQMRKHRTGNSALALVFSSKNFYQAWRRMGYLRQFGEWRRKKSADIKHRISQLDYETQLLAQTRAEQSQLLASQQEAGRALEQQRGHQQEVVNKLQGQGVALRQHLAQKQREANALRNKISELIAAEQAEAERKAREEQAARERAEAERRQQEDQARQQAQQQQQQQAQASSQQASGQSSNRQNQQSSSAAQQSSGTTSQNSGNSYAEARNRESRNNRQSSSQSSTASSSNASTTSSASSGGKFAAAKGSLPKPASGKFRVVSHFGRQTYADMPDVVYDNPGIDAEVAEGASALAVFDGKVSGVYKLDGFSTVVIVAHDGYYTVYGNLDSATVTSGQTVKQGQTLGRIGKNADTGDGGLLHFEVWKNREKQNPEAWIK